MNHMGDVMVSVLIISVIERLFEPCQGQSRTKIFVFAASPLNTTY